MGCQPHRLLRPASAGAGQPLRVLFFMEHLGRYLRFFDSVIRELIERGHTVQLVFEREEGAPGPLEQAWLARMERHPNFSWSHIARVAPRPLVPRRAAGARRTRLRLLPPARRGPRARTCCSGARRRAPETFQQLMRIPGMSSPTGLRAWSRLLDLCDRAIPLSERVQRFVRDEHPDVVLVTPHLMPASTDVHYARSAAATGVPTAICVASWDNLSSKQLLRVVPDLVTVWNDTQKEEATGLHGVPADRVVVHRRAVLRPLVRLAAAAARAVLRARRPRPLEARTSSTWAARSSRPR